MVSFWVLIGSGEKEIRGEGKGESLKRKRGPLVEVWKIGREGSKDINES